MAAQPAGRCSCQQRPLRVPLKWAVLGTQSSSGILLAGMGSRPALPRPKSGLPLLFLWGCAGPAEAAAMPTGQRRRSWPLSCDGGECEVTVVVQQPAGRQQLAVHPCLQATKSMGAPSLQAICSLSSSRPLSCDGGEREASVVVRQPAGRQQLAVHPCLQATKSMGGG